MDGFAGAHQTTSSVFFFSECPITHAISFHNFLYLYYILSRFSMSSSPIFTRIVTRWVLCRVISLEQVWWEWFNLRSNTVSRSCEYHIQTSKETDTDAFSVSSRTRPLTEKIWEFEGLGRRCIWFYSRLKTGSRKYFEKIIKKKGTLVGEAMVTKMFYLSYPQESSPSTS